ncbi:MAG: beta-N-acetylglucosaminidase domain-containing protein [Acidimicrobiales bacterium]
MPAGAIPPAAPTAAVGPGPLTGLIEGFYGRPWSWSARAEVLAFCHAHGLSHYVYAPKDDPLHRHDWRVPYPDADLDGFAGLVAAETMRIGFAVSPGLSIDAHDPTDRAALAAKVDQVVATGIDLVCLALDDIPVRPGLGEEHAALTAWLADHLGDGVRLVLVPTEYAGTRPTPYLDALAAGVPEEVAIAWTGPTVVCDEITVGQAAARAEVLGGRAPLLWDNYPVNDAVMADRLFMGPLRGRDPGLRDACCGHLANPMVQPRASLLPLASVAAWVRGDDPEAAWRREADRRGWRAFAEACDGEVPRRLVADVVGTWDVPGRDDALARLEGWLDEAVGAEAPGLEEEAEAWREQVRAEAGLARSAVALLRTLPPTPGLPFDHAGAVQHALLVGWVWREVARSPVTVFGPRLSLRPVLAQWPDGEFAYRSASLDQGRNAVDALCRFALDRLAAATEAALPPP